MAFLRAGVLGFGGGAVCLPLIQREAVNTYGWITDDEFGELVAISNTLPGPINTKLAGYIGYRVAGVVGATIAVCATIVPSVVMLVFLLEVLANVREHPIVAGMTGAIVPVVGMMMALMTWQILTSAAKEIKGVLVGVNVAVVAFLIAMFDLHPAIIVASTIVFALLKPEPKQKTLKEGVD